MKKTNPLKSGFTLIELLVVISIISLLVAILLPVLGKAKTHSYLIVCQSNLRNQAFAWEMYQQDNDGAFYQALNAHLTYGGWEGSITTNFKRPLNLYLGLPPVMDTYIAAEVYRCPADKGGITGVSLPAFLYYGTSYQTNHYIVGPPVSPLIPEVPLWDAIQKVHSKPNINKFSQPSELILAGDFGWYSQWISQSSEKIEWHKRSCYHNIAFMDGHAAFIKVRKGLFITPSYRVLPHRSLTSMAQSVQVEIQCD